MELPTPGYVNDELIKESISAVKKYIKKSKTTKQPCGQKRSLLDAGEVDPTRADPIFVEVVFKNIPSNSRTYIHNVILPHHWRLTLGPESYNIAIFVRHRRPENDAQKIQFAKDRELDVENTHEYYEKLFEIGLSEDMRSRISRLISTKELATDYNTFQKMDRLSKTYDFFLADRQLMMNKMNSLPRRLGRRFWVRQKKVPVMVRLDGNHLNRRFEHAMSIEPFYVIGRSSTERVQIGLLGQLDSHLIANMRAFLDKLFALYADNVRLIRIRTSSDFAIPVYADLNPDCPKIVMKKKRIKPKPVVDDFDLLGPNTKVSVHPDGTVKVVKQKLKKRSKELSPSTDSPGRVKKPKIT